MKKNSSKNSNIKLIESDILRSLLNLFLSCMFCMPLLRLYLKRLVYCPRISHPMTLHNGDCNSSMKKKSAKNCPLPSDIFLADAAVRKEHPYVAAFYGQRLVKAVGVVEEALQRYRPSQLAIAFNGGKDCTALLDLVMKTLKNRRDVDSSLKNGHVETISIVYFRVRPQFAALEEFIHEKVGELSQVGVFNWS